MPTKPPVFRGAFTGPSDEFAGLGKRPVVFDVLAPDYETSLLPEGVKLVLHVNPSQMQIKYARKVERLQTRGGYVEQHWGDDTQQISFQMATGGFMRLYSGLSNITSPKYGGTRRETLAYDSYLDMLALFHNNASIYDANGQIALQGIIKVTFDGGVYLGWFTSFSVTESSDKPFMFTLSAEMDIAREVQVWRSTVGPPSATAVEAGSQVAEAALPEVLDLDVLLEGEI
jgi:hypothetical protein